MITVVTEAAGLDAAAAAVVAVLYKHSPRCGAALVAEAEVGRFAQRHPDVPVFQLDVVHHRALARQAAARFGVRHASPQALLLRSGRVVWAGAHGEVDAATLDQQVRARPPA